MDQFDGIRAATNPKDAYTAAANLMSTKGGTDGLINHGLDEMLKNAKNDEQLRKGLGYLLDAIGKGQGYNLLTDGQKAKIKSVKAKFKELSAVPPGAAAPAAGRRRTRSTKGSKSRRRRTRSTRRR